MTVVLETVRPVARKEHFCETCLGTIGAGDKYVRQRNIGDDGPYVFKSHQLCWVVSLHQAREAGMWTDDGEWPEPSEVREGVANVLATLFQIDGQVSDG